MTRVSGGPEPGLAPTKSIAPEGSIKYINQSGREMCGIEKGTDVTELKISDFHPQCKHLMDKLNLHSVAELAKYAVREGLTSVER